MSEIVIFDTSVLVDDLRTGRHEARIQSSTGLIRNSAVVLAELWRGASTSADRDFVHALSRNHPILTPTEKMWTESGQLLARIRSERGLAPDKLRDLHFDLLIALTACAHGARLITSNRDDFQLVYQYRKFKLEIW